MADAEPNKDTDSAEDIDERIDHIARVVKDYLREGESFLVQCQEDDILVEEAPHTRFEREHPRLYGRLLSLEEQLETGCGLTVALFALGGLFVLGLHKGWWDSWLPGDVGDLLKTWWFYVPLFAAIFFVSDYIYSGVARRIYRRGRDDLLALLREEGLDRDTLVPMLRNAEEFEKITKQLKLDRGPFRAE